MSIKHTFFASAIGLSLLLPGVALADATTDAAGTCLTDSTTGKDRKLFVKWVFISLSKHPEINQLSAVTPEVELETNRAVGNLVTRLMTDDCGAELKAMAQEHGVSSISNAFEVFGRVAMMELMADPKVGSAMSSIEQFIDSERIQEALQLQ